METSRTYLFSISGNHSANQVSDSKAHIPKSNKKDQAEDENDNKCNLQTNHAKLLGPEPKMISCNYCPRKFNSTQAFGGHQNAHRRARATRIEKELTGLHYPNTNATLRVHMKHYYHDFLGIQVNCQTHKPTHHGVVSLGYKSMSHRSHVTGQLNENNLYVAPDLMTKSYRPTGGIPLVVGDDKLEDLDLTLKL